MRRLHELDDCPHCDAVKYKTAAMCEECYKEAKHKIKKFKSPTKEELREVLLQD